MRITQTPVQTDVFTQSFDAVLDPAKLAHIWQDEGPKPRGHQPKLSGPQLVQGLTFHAMAGPGTLAQHVKPLHGVDITDSALTQRRQAAGFEVFRSIANQALVPLADPLKHPHSFYGPWRLVALDGSQPVVLCDAPDPRGGSWSPANVIAFAPNNQGPISRVSASGGSPATVTTVGQAVDFWVDRILHRPLLDEDRAAAIDFISNGMGAGTALSSLPSKTLNTGIALLFDSSYFQWR